MKLSSLNKGLVAHWTMSQDSLKGSLLADKTPYENDGTIYGATFTTDRKGKANSAMSFDGVDDYITFTSNGIPMGSDVFTISAWVYLNVHDVPGIITWWGNTADNNANGLRTAPGGYFRHYFWANDYDVYTGNLSNKWSHIVLEHIGGGNRIFYLNGLKISGSYVGRKTSPDVQPTNIYIGARAGSLEFFDGLIDDVRIYNRALSETEIKTLYNSYNPKIVMKTSLPKIKLYGGDK